MCPQPSLKNMKSTLFLIDYMNNAGDMDTLLDAQSKILRLLIPHSKSAILCTSRSQGRLTASHMKVSGLSKEGSSWYQDLIGSLTPMEQICYFSHYPVVFSLAEISTDVSHFFSQENISCDLSASLIHKDEPYGCLSIFRSSDSRPFSPEEKDLLFIGLNTFATQIAFRLDQNPNALPGDTLTDIYHLSRREAEVARLLLQNLSIQQICDQLYISSSTLRKHITHIYQKTNVKNRYEFQDLLK